MMLPNDTLVCDSARLARWQTDPGYDYNRELVAPEINVYEWLGEWFERLMRAIFGNHIATEYSEIILVSFFVVAIALIVWFVYRKRPELFTRSKKTPLPYEVHEDNIYGIDFDAEISKALSHDDYRSAVRFLYLQTLKHLSDHNLIDWQLYKTPTQYIYEVEAPRKSPFRDLTNRFLRVRYGNYDADRRLFNEMLTLQKEVQKGGEDEVG